MPYIEKQQREALENRAPQNAGELNYCITTTVMAFIEEKGQSYETFNASIGALECAKLELYRRRIVPYEDKKIVSNGDVY